jgi:SOS-response transcriptional repressor LexA
LNARDFIASLDLANWSNWLVVEQAKGFLYGVSTKSSMEPRFPKGTILVVDSQASACDGDLVLVQYPNTQEATLRELVLDGPMKLLYPVNSHSEKQTLTEDIYILGVVIQSRFNF